jgi:hypothetical protein
MFCSKCGEKNDDDGKYCAQCGNNLSGGQVNQKNKKNRGVIPAMVFIGIVASILLLLFSSSNSPSHSDAKKRLEQRYLNSINILTFNETNAKEGELFGVKVYEMQYEAEIEYLDDLIVNPFEIRKGELIPFENLFGGHQVKKGTREKIAGAILFERTKKGWVATQVR